MQRVIPRLNCMKTSGETLKDPKGSNFGYIAFIDS
jgi:hypothetical protein